MTGKSADASSARRDWARCGDPGGLHADVRLGVVQEVHDESLFPPVGRDGVDAGPGRVHEAHPAVRVGLEGVLPAGWVHQDGRAGAGGQGGGQRLAGAKLQADILEAARREPPQGVRDEQRKRHPQRKVGPVQIEPDQDGLDATLVHRIDQRRQIGFHQRASAPQGPDCASLPGSPPWTGPGSAWLDGFGPSPRSADPGPFPGPPAAHPPGTVFTNR